MATTKRTIVGGPRYLGGCREWLLKVESKILKKSSSIATKWLENAVTKRLDFIPRMEALRSKAVDQLPKCREIKGSVTHVNSSCFHNQRIEKMAGYWLSSLVTCTLLGICHGHDFISWSPFQAFRFHSPPEHSLQICILALFSLYFVYLRASTIT